MPSQKATSTVLISVPRNPSGPEFIREPYRVTINIKQDLFVPIFTAVAIDADGVRNKDFFAECVTDL